MPLIRQANRIVRLVLFIFMGALSAAAQLQEITLPVLLNGEPVGEMPAQIGTNGVMLSSREIHKLLDPLLAEPLRRRLPPAEPPVWISPEILQQAGIRFEYDPALLQVALAVPPESREVRTFDFRAFTVPRSVTEAKPGDFSAYMNLRGGVDYVSQSSSLQQGFTDPQTSFESAFNYRNLVLENEFRLNPSSGKLWQKDNTRLVWSDEPRRVQYSAGDLTYSISGLQSFIPLGGLSIQRDNALQPYRVTEPLGNTSFFLKQDSKVEVLLNGRPMQTLQMPAGPHNLRNFPFTSGGNDVTLKITDPVGRVEYVRMSFFFHENLLLKRESDFSFSVGVPSTATDDPLYHYDTAQPTCIGFYRHGLSDKFTAGASFSGNGQNILGGPSLTYATPVGIFDSDAAASRDETLGMGKSARFQYRLYSKAPPFTEGVLALGALYRDAAFTTYALNPHPSEVQWELSARYSQRILASLSAGVGYSYRINRYSRNSDNISFDLSQRIRAASLDLRLERLSQEQGVEYRALLSLMVPLGGGHRSFSSYDSGGRVARTEWQYTPNVNVGSVGGNLGYQHSPQSDDGFGGVRYTGYNGEVGLSHDVQSGDTLDNRTSLRWGTALVYADGAWGVSRPVYNSFAIVNPQGDLQGQDVGVYPQGDRFLAKSDLLGPAVVPDLTPYHYHRLTVQPLEASLEHDSSADDFLLKPTYRSGAVLRPGQLHALAITFTLMTAEGKPVALQSGTLAQGQRSIEFFSNREGLVLAAGLEPGVVAGYLSGAPEKVFELRIPEQTRGMLDLGQVRLAPGAALTL